MPKKPVAVSLRKPPQASNVEAFVSGEAAPGKPSKVAQVAATPVQDTEPVVQHGAREYREMTLYLPTDVARKLSFFCMDKNCDINGVVAEAVNRHVEPEQLVEAVKPAEPTKKEALVALVDRSKDRLRGLWSFRPWH